MREVHLGYKAFDVHELLCHGIAETGGLYAAADIKVRLLDTTFMPDEALPENTFQVGCGAALASFLAGQRRKVVFVACDRPMFWLYGRPGIDDITHIAQGRVATFPEAAPPANFLKKLLADAGVAPGLIPCRDDVSRLALLSSGSVDAALLSSYFMPAEVRQRECSELAFVGESLRLPTTGLAVTQETFEAEPELIAQMVGIYQQAMKSVFQDDNSLLCATLTGLFGMPKTGLDQTIDLIRNCYNAFGYTCDAALQISIDAMAANMQLSTRPAGELYEFKYIKSYN